MDRIILDPVTGFPEIETWVAFRLLDFMKIFRN